MPARIDPGRRRAQVVDAALRLVAAEGVGGMSLRRVADAAGLNVGSVRHFFDGHHDLLIAAAEEAGARMGRRLARHPLEGLHGLHGEAALDALQSLVEEVLPVDAERRELAIVVTEFVIASRTMSVFVATAARMAEDLGDVLRQALSAVGAADPETGAAQVAALIGGLTVDAVTPHGALGADRVREILRAQLRLLLERAGRRVASG